MKSPEPGESLESPESPGSLTWTCTRCATRLHEDCFAYAEACPTLGCAARAVVFAVRLRRRGASAWSLATCLAVLLAAWASVPRIIGCLRIFEKKKRCGPALTAALEVSHSMQAELGKLSLLVLVVLIVAVFLKWRERAAVRDGLTAITVVSAALIPVTFLWVLITLTNMPHLV